MSNRRAALYHVTGSGRDEGRGGEGNPAEAGSPNSVGNFGHPQLSIISESK